MRRLLGRNNKQPNATHRPHGDRAMTPPPARSRHGARTGSLGDTHSWLADSGIAGAWHEGLVLRILTAVAAVWGHILVGETRSRSTLESYASSFVEVKSKCYFPGRRTSSSGRGRRLRPGSLPGGASAWVRIPLRPPAAPSRGGGCGSV